MNSRPGCAGGSMAVLAGLKADPGKVARCVGPTQAKLPPTMACPVRFRREERIKRMSKKGILTATVYHGKFTSVIINA